MMVVLLTGVASMVLFGVATWLILQAGAKPPTPIRTYSRRSQAEYAYNRRCAARRRQGFLCLMAGVVNLCLSLTIGIWSAVDTLAW